MLTPESIKNLTIIKIKPCLVFHCNMSWHYTKPSRDDPINKISIQSLLTYARCINTYKGQNKIWQRWEKKTKRDDQNRLTSIFCCSICWARRSSCVGIVIPLRSDRMWDLRKRRSKEEENSERREKETLSKTLDVEKNSVGATVEVPNCPWYLFNWCFFLPFHFQKFYLIKSETLITYQ